MKNIFKILVGVLIFFFLYYGISYFYWEKKAFEDDNYYFQEEEEDKNIIELNSSLVKNLYKVIDMKRIQESFGKDFSQLFYGERTNVSELPNKFLLYLISINLEDIDYTFNCSDERSFTEEEFDNKAKELFGPNITYFLDSFEIGEDFILKLDEDKKTLTLTNNSCGGINFKEEYVGNYLVKAEEFDDRLELTVAAYYVSFKTLDNGTVISNFHENTNPMSKIISDSSKEEFPEKNISLYNFTYVKNNDNYYLLSIKKNN